MVMLIVLIMMILIVTMIVMILLMMMINTEKMEVLEDYLKSLTEIITNQQEPNMVLNEEKTIRQNIRVEETDMKFYHQNNISI